MDEKRSYRTFFGSYSPNSCAYCWKHHLALTPKQLKKKRCLEKRCDALSRCDHPYWEQREKRKKQRSERKERLENLYKEVTANGVRTEEASIDSGRVLEKP